MCEKYSEEILKSHDLWIFILNALFSFSKHKKLRNKTYCKTYFKNKLVVFCKQLLTILPFKVILPEVIKMFPNVRYKRLQSFIDEIFLDRLAEHDMCISAAKLVQ